MRNIGIIGVGHMGSALLTGWLRAGFSQAQTLFISGGKSAKAKDLAQQTGCHFCKDNADLVQRSDIIVLAVSPAILPQVLASIKTEITSDKLLISVAASYTLADIQKNLPDGHTAFARAIPNIPAAICQGMTAIAANEQMNAEDRGQLEGVFQAIGKIAWVEESKLNIASTVAGCSPAYVAVFIEAMADAGVKAGLNREQAYLLSEQAVLGAAATLLEKKMLPAELKDGVASPGGTTIRGVAALEQYGLRNAVMQAVAASAGK